MAGGAGSKRTGRARAGLLEAVGEGTKMAGPLSPKVRPAFPSSAIISERSSPSRVRYAAPNNGAPLTACGPFQNNTHRRGKGSLQTARFAGDHFAAILVPFFAATDNLSPHTVETHRGYIMQKLNLHSGAEVILHAIRKGVIT
jgi:hypothetical protein